MTGRALLALWVALMAATFVTENPYVLGAFLGAGAAFLLWAVVDSEVDR